jgi:hypothetical protein
MSHLSEGEIERFLKARATREERQRVVRHLLAGCGVCRRRIAEKAPGPLLDETGERRRGRVSQDPLRTPVAAAVLEQDFPAGGRSRESSTGAARSRAK